MKIIHWSSWAILISRPEDIDIGIGEPNRQRWLKQGKCSFLPEEREWYDALKARGLVDAYRVLNPTKDDKFSWFDYRSRGFEDTPNVDFVLITI